MPDYMDQLVDAQTENEMADLKAAAKQTMRTGLSGKRAR